MTENVRLTVDTLRYCEESGARCGECPSGKDENGIPNCHSMSAIADLIEKLWESLEYTGRERDAAMRDIKKSAIEEVKACYLCLYNGGTHCTYPGGPQCNNNTTYWVWRGLCAGTEAQTMERKPMNRNEAKTDHVRNGAEKETDHIRYCRYCKSRDITPVKITSHYGKKARICYNCPVCGEYLDVVWEKGGRENA